MEASALLPVLECLPLGVLVLDVEGRVLAQNRAAELMIENGSGGEAGGSFRDAVRPEIVGIVTEVVEAVLRDGYALPRQIDVDLGEQRTTPAALSGSLARDENGAAAGIVLVVQDMSAAEELARRTRLEASRAHLVAEASHEIRNPLTAVHTALELLLQSTMPESERRLADLAYEHVRRVLALLRDILDAARLEAGAAAIERAPVALAVTIPEVLEAIRAANPDATIRVEIEPGLPPVMGERRKLDRVIRNLVENAIKYSPQEKEVRVSARRVDQAVEIAVSDRGMGIAPEELPRIFDKFYRARAAESRRVPGSGLGLAMVKAIVEAHGGTIRVESEPERGSTFRVRLSIA
jgi:signal transduction histidine kinase